MAGRQTCPKVCQPALSGNMTFVTEVTNVKDVLLIAMTMSERAFQVTEETRHEMNGHPKD